MKVHFNVTGPLIWLDENGEPVDATILCLDWYGGHGTDRHINQGAEERRQQSMT